MNAEFDWWLLLVGIVGGAGLAWLLLADARRRDDELAEDERQLEADWIATAFREAGRRIDPSMVEDVLRLHRAYLEGPAPDRDPLDPPAPAERAAVRPDDAPPPAAEPPAAPRTAGATDGISDPGRDPDEGRPHRARSAGS